MEALRQGKVDARTEAAAISLYFCVLIVYSQRYDVVSRISRIGMPCQRVSVIKTCRR